MVLLLLFVFIHLLTGTLTATESALSGHHLRVLVMEFPVSFVIKWNATGHLVHADGIQKHLIEALSHMLNFSYSFVPIGSLLPDDTPSGKGAISYLVNDEADYYLSSTVIYFYRFQRVDFPAYWIYFPFSTLLPYPKERENLTASFEPLSNKVWILIVISALIIVLFLKMMLRKNKRSGSISHEGIVPYVIGNLVSQGQRYFPNRLAVRVAAGAWCCTCFFLVQIYCCTLTSHLTSPNRKPLVNSFFDIADTPGVSLTVDKAYALDTIMKITESANLKRFVDTLKKDDRLITCKTTVDCMKYVNSGNAVYSAPVNSLSVIMAADLKNKSTCHYTRLKETFWSTPAYTVLRKNSPYTEPMSRGILRLQEAGLIDKWEKWYVPSNSKCMKVNERKGMPRLSLTHLSSTFVILIAGYFISLLAFLMENFIAKLIRIHQMMRVVVVYIS